MDAITFEKKYEKAIGYWLEHDGLRIPEIPHFNDNFIKSQRVAYTIDKVANNFLTNNEMWEAWEQMHLDIMIEDADKDEKQRIIKALESSDQGWAWTYILEYPSGWEIWVDHVLSQPNIDDQVVNAALENIKTHNIYPENVIVHVLNQDEGYNIHPTCREWLKNELKENSLWGKTLTNTRIVAYNTIIDNFTDKILYETALVSCDIKET